jgi:OOP family OmpA-OmpF porin
VLTANLTAKGYGESEPIADNDTEEGREANRRIEFRLILPEDAAAVAEAGAEAPEGEVAADAAEGEAAATSAAEDETTAAEAPADEATGTDAPEGAAAPADEEVPAEEGTDQ